MTTTSLDNGIYFYHNNDLSGILVCHVDDVLWSGTEMFEQNIIKPLGRVFTFGTVHCKAFKYLGIDLEQHDDYSISLSQTNFANSIKKASISGNPGKTAPVNKDICSELRTFIGKLNWLACISKPEISFEVSYLSSRVTEATIGNVIKANKIVTRIQANPSRLLFLNLDRRFLHIQVFTDGSFNSLPKSGNQGGQIVLLCDKQQNCSMLAWNSSRLKIVTRSTLAAETLAICDGCELALYTASLLNASKLTENPQVIVVTDSRSLFEALGSSKQVSDKRLRLDVGSLREMIKRDEITINWVQGSRQLSDALTKHGASWRYLTTVMETGNLQQQ